MEGVNMNEGRTVERNFGVLVSHNRARLFEEALKHLRSILGPQWSTRLTDLGRAGKLATKSPMFFAMKGEYDVPMTINTRGNQIKILLDSGGTHIDLQELATELERIVRTGRAPTHKEWSEAEAARRTEINRKRGSRKNKKRSDNKPIPLNVSEPVSLSSSVAQTHPKPKSKLMPTTYLQTEFEKRMRDFEGDNSKGTPLANDNQTRVRRISVLHRVQGVFRRVRDHLKALSESYDNITKFIEILQIKINGGETLYLEQYEAMCAIITMVHPEINETKPPEILQIDLDRLVQEIKVF